MKNYAGRNDIDNELVAELQSAGINVFRHGEWRKNSSKEVKTDVTGTLHGWVFERAWTYWAARGPGLPLAYAMPLHKTHGKEVRVAGDCSCPSPLQHHKGFAPTLYHVDTAEGLKALADALRLCVAEAGYVEEPA